MGEQIEFSVTPGWYIRHSVKTGDQAWIWRITGIPNLRIGLGGKKNANVGDTI